MAETNLAMMRAAADALMPKRADAPRSAEPASPAKSEEFAELRAQMAAMQKKLDELGK
jgi:polyhydroxyalkanoate synthesis regulator protein